MRLALARLPLARLRRALACFRRDESGSATVEAMIMVPMLLWFYFGTLVFFQAFHAQAVNGKTAYTIGDLLSRETDYVTPGFISGLFALQGVLLDTTAPRALRITVFAYDADDDRYVVRWSRPSGSIPALTTADLANMRDILPVMPDGEIAILTHSRVDFVPPQDVGLTDFTFDEYTVTRPRFAPQLCWNSVENGTAATAIC